MTNMDQHKNYYGNYVTDTLVEKAEIFRKLPT